MSIKYMQRVWTTKELKGGALLVMLALADHANDAGECWPSQKHLAEKARLEERQVRRVIGTLVKDGYLTIKDRIADHGRKTKYQLFPDDTKPVIDEPKADKMSGQQEDILSGSDADILSGEGEKADILSEKKRTFCPPDILSTGHLEPEKADISDTIYSHARSESPIEPSGKNGIISSSSSEEVDFMPAVHPITALPFKPRPAITSPPLPRPTDDPWIVAVAELSRTLAGGFVPMLQESRLELVGEIDGEDGKPTRLYRLIVPAARAAQVPHFIRQAGAEIQKKLSSILSKRVYVEIVTYSTSVAEPEPA